MIENTAKFDHLIKNLTRITKENSIINNQKGEKICFSLKKGNLNQWLDTLLPNTRLIIEPKITGIGVALHYENNKLKKVFTKNSIDLTQQTNLIKQIPKEIDIKQEIEIHGQLYIPKINTSNSLKAKDLIKIKDIQKVKINYCAFRIVYCELNNFQSIKELQKMNFEVPKIEFTQLKTDVHLFLKYWKAKRIFKDYPTSGLVLKINSKRLQKHLGENNISINWAYTVF